MELVSSVAGTDMGRGLDLKVLDSLRIYFSLWAPLILISIIHSFGFCCHSFIFSSFISLLIH